MTEIEHEKEQENRNRLEEYQKTDSVNQGRDHYFMTVDSWIQDGNFSGRYDDFGPVLEQEEPPTVNGNPIEEE